MKGSFTTEYDPDLERIHNLYCFSINFSKYVNGNDPICQSPDYIMEKYHHWIGSNPCITSPLYTPDDITNFMINYFKTWRYLSGPMTESTDLQRILIYLKLTESKLDLIEMFNIFEKYIGPISMISSDVKIGLHPKLYDFVSDVINRNDDTITILLRDMKIGKII